MSISPPPLTTDTVTAIDFLKRALASGDAAAIESARREIEPTRRAHDARALARVRASREYMVLSMASIQGELDVLRKNILDVEKRQRSLTASLTDINVLLCDYQESHYMEKQYVRWSDSFRMVCKCCGVAENELHMVRAFKSSKIRKHFHFFDECFEDFEPMPDLPPL